MGVAKYFKEMDKNIKCFVLEPDVAPILSEGIVNNPNHRIQGGGYSMEKDKLQFDLEEESYIDGYLKVSDQEAKDMSQLLALHEGIFGGYSSGCNVAGAVKLLKSSMAGRTVVCIICDSGLKYISTDLWKE